ncbi:hypothetical protein V5740_09585 [Croceibacterium sp. TMG7-5b_MA50]|uniref:hypothetical protein n=1 Tax=Croceibacterium sp. TMG7-5b_MA50 TaxID=3121290 RepID=UPI003221888F
MSFWRRISPRRAVEDFAHEWRQPAPHRWKVLGVSVAATFFIGMMFVPKSQRIEPRPPEVTWITSYAADRSDAEIAASNLANQQRQDEIAARLAKREEIRKNLYRELGRATFLDVDEMERKIAADEAAAAARASEAATGAAPAN